MLICRKCHHMSLPEAPTVVNTRAPVTCKECNA